MNCALISVAIGVDSEVAHLDISTIEVLVVWDISAHCLLFNSRLQRSGKVGHNQLGQL